MGQVTGTSRNIAKKLRTPFHNLPMVEYTLREGLSTGLKAELCIESERLGNRQVCFDGEHGCSDALLVAEYLGAMLMEAVVHTANGVLRCLYLHWMKWLIRKPSLRA